jgi:hypothetical protein
MELFSLRKIRRICLRHRGPGPPEPAHGSTDFIKCRSSASGSTTQIESSEPVSRLLISAVHRRSNGWGGWLRPRAAPSRAHGRARRLAGVWVFSSYGGRFSMRFAPMGSQRRGERVYANLNRQRAVTVRWLGRCLSTVRAASSEASAPRTCTKASSSSLLASRPTNCSDRRWKTQIWWLPRVRGVLDLRPKIRIIYGAIYRGF